MPNGYSFTSHALQRMSERDITEKDVARVFWCGNRYKADDGYRYSDDQLSVIIKDLVVLTVY